MTRPLLDPTKVPAACRDGSHDVVRLHIAGEPIVTWAGGDLACLYQECRPSVIADEEVLLRADDFDVGDIGLLDTAVVDLVLDALADHPSAVLGCNVSALTLGDPSAIRPILLRLADRPALARRLVIEVADGALVNTRGALAAALIALKAAGCRLALDDFGSGRPALPELIDWDFVKIDRAGVLLRAGCRSEREVLGGIVAHARVFASRVVVEGIDSSVHLRTVRAAGASIGQGGLLPAPRIKRSRTVDGVEGLRIANALLHHGAVAGRPDGASPQSASGQRVQLSRVDGIGGWAKSLVARARAARVPS